MDSTHSGTIPRELGSLSSLQQLCLDRNQLTGEISLVLCLTWRLIFCGSRLRFSPTSSASEQVARGTRLMELNKQITHQDETTC